MTLESNVGFYGKLPVLGDFVSRRLPNDFISSWDKWLQSSLAVSKEKLAEQWMHTYLTSPIWRFALSPGMCGNDAWLGVVMPSVDRVGRYFPLMIASKVPNNYSLVNLFAAGSNWFYSAETALISALENDLSVEDFDRMVQRIGAFSVDQNSRVSCDDKQEYSGFMSIFYTEFNNEVELVEDVSLKLGSLLMDTYVESYSLWSTAGSESVKPGCLVLNGMPAFAVYTGLISGQFQQQGWSLLQQFVENTGLKDEVEEKTQVSLIENSTQSNDEKLVNAIFSSPEQRASVQSWRSFSKTDKGNIRRINEDAILDRPDLGLWVVADGMGGHQAGDLASRKIIHKLNKPICLESLETSLVQVKDSIETVNSELRRIAASDFDQQIIGSTIVTLIAGKNYFACLWAGDSRLYRYRDHQLTQITIDHCEEEGEELDLLRDDSLISLKKSNVITRAVGAFDKLELDCQIIDIKPGDLYLLGSDGLDKELSIKEIEQVLYENIYSDSVELLMEMGLARKGVDNISIIVVEIL